MLAELSAAITGDLCQNKLNWDYRPRSDYRTGSMQTGIFRREIR